MSNSKLSYRVKTRLRPHLESLGFRKSAAPREWVRVTNDVMCAFAMVPSPYYGPSFHDATKGSFILHAGVAYPSLNFGFSDVIDTPEEGGIGWCGIKLTLTRSPGVAGPTNAVVWDPSVITPDDAIDDAIAAIDTQASPFFADWTDPEFAYGQLLDGVFKGGPAGNAAPGVPELYVDAQPDSPARLHVLASLAARLGRVDDEITHIERLNEVSGSALGHSEEANNRLAQLKNS